MLHRIGIAVLVLFVSSAALAQTSPCSGGMINPLLTVMPASKGAPGFQLTFEHATTHTLTIPQVTIDENDVVVTQTPLDIPPPPIAATTGAAALNCNSQVVSLGVLPPGTYNVTWSYILGSPIPGGQPIVVESFNFSFAIADVPALSGAALLALMLLLALAGVVMLRR
jgi:hypothetical protein